MKDRPELLALFTEYEPTGGLKDKLSGAYIEKAEINSDERSVNMTLRLKYYIDDAKLSELRAGLQNAYDFKRVYINPKYPPETLPMAWQVLAESIIEAYPPAASGLAGAAWEFSGTEVTIKLKANGKDELAMYADAAVKCAREYFDVDIKLSFHSDGEMSNDEIIEYTEKRKAEEVKAAAIVPSGKAEVKDKKPAGGVLLGKSIKGQAIKMSELSLDESSVVVEGKVFSCAHRTVKGGNSVVAFDMTDFTGSVRVSQFYRGDEGKKLIDGIKEGMWLTVKGDLSFSKYDNDLAISPKSIVIVQEPRREDEAQQKRVELHLHTRMSEQDALTDLTAAINTAARWGHKAIAITDHGVAHTFPDAHKAAKSAGIKVLYGVEAYYVDDVKGRQSDGKEGVIGDAKGFKLSDEIVAFDLETTGLNPKQEQITEIGAVIYKNGEIINRFQTFVDPGKPLEPEIIELTGITDDMLKGAPQPRQALADFVKFCGDRPLAAHNAVFDMSFIEAGCLKYGIDFKMTALDTLVLTQKLYPDLQRHKLGVVSDELGLPSFTHHRAVDDAEAVANLLTPLFERLKENNVTDFEQINSIMYKLIIGDKMQKEHAKHLILIAKTQAGLRNLYKLISLSHIKYGVRGRPRIPRSVLERNRDGIIMGSACESGELFQAIVAGCGDAELLEIAKAYDYLEIQPVCNNQFLIRNGTAKDIGQLRDYNRKVVALGNELGIPVCATGDVHFLNPEDEIYRRIMLAAKGYSDADSDMPLYFKTTDEMLEEFSYLGVDKAYEVVVKNPNDIADICESLNPLPKGLYPPEIKDSAKQLEELVADRLFELYGDNPPEVALSRVETEMRDIIGCEYDVIYMSAQKLVSKSMQDGYLVGSRGSVGSSIVAFLAGITEVNSLPAHYLCPNCKHAEFDVPEGISVGVDLPDKKCPDCGADYGKTGFDIPFETFLGFGGDKVPDIDLNFSGDYQAKAHKHTVEMFGETRVFRAGTISTIKDKTAYGYVKNYLEERGLDRTAAEVNRLSSGIVGVKRTTGQHPGGLVVLPRSKEIYDFCPIQYPPQAKSTDMITTHFDYHSMEDNLLKLDILGHDDPTMLKMLGDLTGIDPTTILLDDPDTMSIFTSTEKLGYTKDSILGTNGACAIPEFGTSFVRGMLSDTMPTKFETLIKISGFSHGTDVWLGNAKDLITSGTAEVDEVVSCRDDIMLYLITKGMEEKLAFKIMEAVRKGKGLQSEWVSEMIKSGVPQWYIDSCNKIKYLFPKAHAAAYVIMAFRIAWFKVHRPLAFYAAYFTVRAKAVNVEIMAAGVQAVLKKMDEIKQMQNPTQNEQDMLITLEVCYEFYKRGYSFLPLDLYESDAMSFLISGNSLRPPFISVTELGEAAATDIVKNRREFVSIEEFADACSKVSKKHIEKLKNAGAFGDLPETSQLSFF